MGDIENTERPDPYIDVFALLGDNPDVNPEILRQLLSAGVVAQQEQSELSAKKTDWRLSQLAKPYRRPRLTEDAAAEVFRTEIAQLEMQKRISERVKAMWRSLL
ncbi:hypothetical protein KBD59_01215 [Candidatus Gracilibacteria bacterium]|nr:hypothetical protein [Candidatus Gracilibacteria bacterium]